MRVAPDLLEVANRKADLNSQAGSSLPDVNFCQLIGRVELECDVYLPSLTHEIARVLPNLQLVGGIALAIAGDMVFDMPRSKILLNVCSGHPNGQIPLDWSNGGVVSIFPPSLCELGVDQPGRK
jgi:hypothetical protein